MIIVTGASKGLGYAIAKRLITNKINVIGIARNIDGLDFECFKCDVANFIELKKTFKKIKSLTNKKVVGLINSAGIASMNLTLTSPPKITNKVISTNLIGTINCCQVFSPSMIKAKKGVIINFSTIATALGLKGEAIYVASKAGVEGFTRTFAREVSNFNVRVNCIAPGPIKTNLLKGVSDDQISKIIHQQVIQKQFETHDICDLVELLLDKRASSLSGQILKVGGS